MNCPICRMEFPYHKMDCQNQHYTDEVAKHCYEQGWHECADWSDRDDLKFDTDSPAYEKYRKLRIGV